MNITKPLVASLLLLCIAQEALADKTYILATGRRDPRILGIDDAVLPGMAAMCIRTW